LVFFSINGEQSFIGPPVLTTKLDASKLDEMNHFVITNKFMGYYMLYRTRLNCPTRGRGFYHITDKVNALLANQNQDGLCHLFINHTSASLLITENADPQVLQDMERFMARLVPDGDPLFHHIAEGSDDMLAHIRSALSRTSLTVPVEHGQLMLGTWQGIYLWEHRHQGQCRQLLITLL
jgi:secondary thiamine-phosphate synthase enzyme